MISGGELWATLAGVSAVLLALRVEQHFDTYWSVSQLLLDPESPPAGPVAVTRRFAYPLAVSLVVVALFGLRVGTGLAIGLASAFLVVWPVIYQPRLLPFGSSGREGALYMLYASFVCSFGVAGLAGGALGSALRAFVASTPRLAHAVENVAYGLVAAAIWAALVAATRRTRRRYEAGVSRRAAKM